MLASYLCTIVHVWLVRVKRHGVAKTNITSSGAARDMSFLCREHGS
jgi:hypothetical protein